MNELVFARNSQFDLAKIFDCGQCFRFERTDEREGTCSFEGVAYDRYLYASQTDSAVTVRYSGKRDDAFVFRYFDLETDYAAIARSFMSDPVLARASKVARGIRILRQEPWETLCSFIISQNNNIPRIKKIIRTLSEVYGEQISLPDGRVFFAFPTAHALKKAGSEALYACGTGFRAKYLSSAAEMVSDNPFFLTETAALPTVEAAENLKRIKGVGDKVAACTLLFGFARYDAFPVDVWIKRVLAESYPDGAASQLSGAFAGIAQQYLFYMRRYTEK